MVKGETLTIMLVEDNPADAALIARVLRSAGLSDPVRLADGQLAIDYLAGAGEHGDRALHPLPSLILLDLGLPGVSGFEVLAWLRRQPALQHIPAVVLTGSRAPADIKRAYDLGAASFLIKHADPALLLDLVSTLALPIERPLRLLLVDDDSGVRALVARELRREFPQIELVQVIDQAALDTALAGAPFDLVITDYHLSWSDGLTVLHTVKTRFADCPVIMFTATGSEEIAVEAMKTGLDDYVLKSPKHFGRLSGAVRSSLGRTYHRLALREAESRYRTLLNAVPVGVYRSTPNGKLLDANPAMAEVLGYPDRESLLAVDSRDFFFDDAAYRSWRALLNQPGTVRNQVISMRRRDGRAIWAKHDGHTTCDEEGRIRHSDAIIEDITEHRQLSEQLLQSQKIEAIGRLAGGVAHDFNNLLQAMLSVTQMLRSKAVEPERVAAVAIELEAQIKRGASLTRQLLLFSRREVARWSTVDVNELARAAESLLRRLMRENIRLQVEPAATPVIVDGDPGQLEQVLLNLAVNGSDAMPGGGDLAIRVGGGADGMVWIEVADSGHGIPAEILDKIFEPFFTTKAAGQGTGLGLSVTQGIVAAHGGRIELESETGHGTTIRVLLPRSGKPQPVDEGLAAGAEVPRGQGERVLIVEDEQGAREGLAEILTVLGYEATAVESAEEAQRVPAAPPFRVVLSDLMLPGMDGGELAEHLRRRWPNLSVILMSGYTEDEALRRTVGDAAVRFLQKPFDMDTLAREVRAALEDRSGQGLAQE